MNKKYLLILLCVVFVFLLVFIINLTKKDNYSWIGNYQFVEFFPTGTEALPNEPQSILKFIEYNLSIYDENGILFAEIDNWGWQTSQHFLAEVIGDNEKIDIIFIDFLENNTFNTYYQNGDLLLSFSFENNQLYTTWHKLQSETSYMSNEFYGIYYEKIK